MFQENPDLDLYFVQNLNMMFVNTCSLRAIDEFNKLIPEKIDRHDHTGMQIVNIAPNSFGLMSSTPNWNERRKLATKTIGINFASKYIPMMVQTVDEWSKNIKTEENLDLTIELKRITFKIITKILFGRDINKMEKCQYYSPHDGSISSLDFEDAYFRYSKDIFDTHFSALSKLIPFLATIKITEPFKSNERNKVSIYSALRNFLDMSEDEHSVYKQLLNSGELSKEEIFCDTVLLLFAGFDTTSHAIGSTLYYLHKYPQVLRKLKEVLDKDKISDINPLQDESLKDLYENWDYRKTLYPVPSLSRPPSWNWKNLGRQENLM